ncbi:hypothetical protein GPX23_04405 [Streptococcus thermophilus]|nr:hypothetical protein [Streptococcus thermophilus]MCE2274588.1 hypothetical protein [Streptococcus thermophilus]
MASFCVRSLWHQMMLKKLLRYFNYDLLDKPTMFNGAKSAYMLSGTKLHFGKEMIIEEEQAAMEASINV